jgi:hypothetical protein
MKVNVVNCSKTRTQGVSKKNLRTTQHWFFTFDKAYDLRLYPTLSNPSKLIGWPVPSFPNNLDLSHPDHPPPHTPPTPPKKRVQVPPPAYFGRVLSEINEVGTPAKAHLELFSVLELPPT